MKSDVKDRILYLLKSTWHALLNRKKLFIKVISITFIIACVLTLSLPNYYSVNVTLAPEMSGKSNSGGGLSSLASSFGVSLGGMTSGEDALSPTLYPDMMKSVEFKTSLFPLKVRELGSSEFFTYYEYLKDYQKYPWWTSAIKYIRSLFQDKNDTVTVVNPFMLTKKQTDIIRVMDKKISCAVDKKTNVISIGVIDQDPLVAATLADSVKQRLQDAITAYRTSKARVDLEYNKKLYEETKAKYDEARHQYAAFADANFDVILQRDRNKQIELENEMQLRYQAYSTVAAQLQAAEAKVQEETPAFTTIQNVTVPVQKSGPSRTKLVLLYCFLAFLITCIYIMKKEGYLIPLVRLALGFDWEDNSKKEA